MEIHRFEWLAGCKKLPETLYEINKNTLYEDLELLITSPEKIMKYGEKGRKWVEKNHHYSSVVQSLYQIYKSNQIL